MSGYISQSSVDTDVEEEEPNGIEFLKRALPSKKNFGVLYDLYATNCISFPLTLSFENEEKVMKPRPITKKMLDNYVDIYTSESGKVYNKLVSVLDDHLKQMSVSKLQEKKMARKLRQKAKTDRRVQAEKAKWDAGNAKMVEDYSRNLAELQELKAGKVRQKKKQRLSSIAEENESNVG